MCVSGKAAATGPGLSLRAVALAPEGPVSVDGWGGVCGLGTCISHGLPGAAAAAGPRTATLGESLAGLGGGARAEQPVPSPFVVSFAVTE